MEEDRRHELRRDEDQEFDKDCKDWVRLQIEKEKRSQAVWDKVKANIIIWTIITTIGGIALWKYNG